MLTITNRRSTSSNQRTSNLEADVFEHANPSFAGGRCALRDGVPGAERAAALLDRAAAGGQIMLFAIGEALGAGAVCRAAVPISGRGESACRARSE